MHRLTFAFSLLLCIVVLTAGLVSSAQTSNDLPAQMTCVSGTTVVLQGSGEVGTALLVQFNKQYVGGGSVKPGGVYTIPLAIDPATKAGEYPVVVEVRGTREILAETICVVPGPGQQAPLTPEPGTGSTVIPTDIPTDESDLDAPTSQRTSTPTQTATPTPTAIPTSTDSTDDEADSSEITIVSAPGRVNRGNIAMLEIRAAPITRCSIQVFYPDSPDGEPNVDGLQDKTTDQNGDASWEWVVEDDVELGDHDVTVTCGDQTAETSITVLE